jgi:HSP20 family protein
LAANVTLHFNYQKENLIMIASPQTSLAPERQATAAETDRGLTYRPNVDIADCGSELVLVADIPGSVAEQIDVSFDDGVLAITATVRGRPQAGNPVRQEYGVGDYRRSFQIGEGFDGRQTAAAYRNGVLTVRVPRLAAVRPRTIPVTAG